METIRRSLHHLGRVAIASERRATTYGSLLSESLALSAELSRTPELLRAKEITASQPSTSQFVRYPHLTRGPRIALMAPPGEDYVRGTWATWMQGGICVPLAIQNPARELEYVLRDSGCSVILASQEYLDLLHPLANATGACLLPLSAVPTTGSSAISPSSVPHVPEIPSGVGSKGDAGALIIYTSGTTGKPKGVLHSHGGLRAQMEGMIDSWGWAQDDRILHALPLHHIHGIVNALYTPLLCGASVEIHKIFSPDLVWESFQRPEDGPSPPPSVFMGVPTMYSRLISHFDSLPREQQLEATRAAAKLRLYVSGSSACPVPLMERWKEVSGKSYFHLERYGMTEIGMALSNPYLPGEDRRAGTVGVPLPGVEAKIVRTASSDASDEEASTSSASDRASAQHGGELLIRSTGMFVEYWGKPEKTEEAFTEDGYFLTGDTVAREPVQTTQGTEEYYRILGRTSVDILKTRGFKVSALQVEDALLENSMVAECAVFGLDDAAQGQVVAAVVALKKPQGQPDLDLTSTKQIRGLELQLRKWLKEFLPPYAIPEKWFFVPAVPRNAMGKVNKKDLNKTFSSTSSRSLHS